MKKLAYALLLAGTLIQSEQMYAQAVATCGATAPEVQTGLSTIQPGGTIWTTPPPIQVQASPTTTFTHVEYLITKRGRRAMTTSGGTTPDTTGGGGDVILGATATGNFNPGTVSRYGVRINAGDTFDLTAVGYKLQQIKDLSNKIFTGRTVVGATCCALINAVSTDARGFCDSLRAAGYDGQEDINGLQDVIALFDAFSPKEVSVAGLIANMQTVNGYQSSLPNECGKNDLPVCFGINKNARYGYVASNTVAVEELSANTNFMLFPNPAENGFVNVLIDSKNTADIRLSLYNTLGEQINTQVLNGLNGQTTLSLETNTLNAGIYFVELTDGTSRQTRKLLVR